MKTRKASIKETGEELSQEQWARFDAAVAEERAGRQAVEPFRRDAATVKRDDDAREAAPDR